MQIGSFKSLNGTALNLHAKAHSCYKDAAERIKTKTVKHMKIEVGGDKSQDEINGKVNRESDDNLNSVDDYGTKIRFEKNNEIDEEATEEKGSNEEENNDANAQFQHSESRTRDNDSDIDSDTVSIWLDSDQSTLDSSLHRCPENISSEESPAEYIYIYIYLFPNVKIDWSSRGYMIFDI